MQQRRLSEILPVLVLLLLGAQDEVVAADAAIWRARAVEHWEEFQRGDQFLAMGYRANDRLPNEFAHLIDAYVALHKLTSDPEWMSVAARQLDVVASGTDTWYRNGIGWSTPRYSSSLIRNGSGIEKIVTETALVSSEAFEMADATGLSPGWARVQSTPATAYRDPTAGVGDSGCLMLVTDAVNWVSADVAFTNLKPDTPYVIETQGWTDSPPVRPWMDVRMGEAEWTWLATTPTVPFPPGVLNEWRRVSFSFRTPEDLSGAVRLRLVVSDWRSAGARIKFDNLALREVTRMELPHWETWSGSRTGVASGEAITLTNDGTIPQSVGQRLEDTWVNANPNYQLGSRYRLRFQARSSAGTSAAATIHNKRTGETIGQVIGNSADWQDFELDFSAPGSSGEDLWLLLSPSPAFLAGESASFRAIEIRQYAGHLIDEALMLNALLQFAQYVSDRPALAATHATRVSGYLALAKTIVGQWDQDWVEHEDFGVFRYADDGAAASLARATVPTNYFTEAATTYLRLYRLTGDQEYLGKAGLLARALRRQLSVEDDCLVWSYHRELLPGSVAPPAPFPMFPEDTAHANSTVLFIIEAYEAKVEFDELDLLRLGNTFLRRLWNGNPSEPVIAANLAGSPPTSSLPMLWHWMKLAASRSEILPIVHAVTEQYAVVDRQGPVHDYLKVWYDQGWRVQQKALLALLLDQWDRADRNNNGIPNIVEYALGTDTPDASNPWRLMPSVSRDGADRLALKFRRLLDRTDLNLTVQAAESLEGPWIALAQSVGAAPFEVLLPGVLAVESGDGASRQVTVTDLYPVADPTHSMRFLRLWVSRF